VHGATAHGCAHDRSRVAPTCARHEHVPFAEPDSPACLRKACCNHGGGKKDDGPIYPVIVRIRSQRGESSLVRVVPPTFAELERYVEEEYNVDDPQLLHGDELGHFYPLASEDDFAHAIRVTGSNRYMTIVLKRYKERPGTPCCCCGHPPPPAKRPKAKKTDVITDVNDVPPGLRPFLVAGTPWRHWTERDEFMKAEESRKKPKRPMMKAFMRP
jgi:hypothetical protein